MLAVSLCAPLKAAGAGWRTKAKWSQKNINTSRSPRFQKKKKEKKKEKGKLGILEHFFG